jgi:NTP pyrophosphatase (non-canonical NTP hydrolase)
MTYYVYHIPGKKIGVTRDLEKRVTEQQGYESYEYEILEETEDIDHASYIERMLQDSYGYRVDETPYNELKFNKEENEMNINITEATTTFPCPVNKLKGRLMDNMGMTWETDHGDFIVNKYSIDWIMKNIQTSRYNDQRCYVYNKAFSRYQDNHQQYDMLGGNIEDVHMQDQYNGKCRAGGLAPTGPRSMDCTNDPCECMQPSQFDLIREWADERGLYDNGDTKTQALKLVEEVGETCRAILKEDFEEVVDGIGDCVVVLTNLAELQGVSIEACIDAAYSEIKNRKGKMVNGTYKKD